MLQIQSLISLSSQDSYVVVKCISRISKLKFFTFGTKILVSIKNYKLSLKNGTKCYGIIIQTLKNIKLLSYIYIHFSNNKLILLNPTTKILTIRVFNLTCQYLRLFGLIKLTNLGLIWI